MFFSKKLGKQHVKEAKPRTDSVQRNRLRRALSCLKRVKFYAAPYEASSVFVLHNPSINRKRTVEQCRGRTDSSWRSKAACARVKYCKVSRPLPLKNHADQATQDMARALPMRPQPNDQQPRLTSGPNVTTQLPERRHSSPKPDRLRNPRTLHPETPLPGSSETAHHVRPVDAHGHSLLHDGRNVCVRRRLARHDLQSRALL